MVNLVRAVSTAFKRVTVLNKHRHCTATHVAARVFVSRGRFQGAIRASGRFVSVERFEVWFDQTLRVRVSVGEDGIVAPYSCLRVETVGAPIEVRGDDDGSVIRVATTTDKLVVSGSDEEERTAMEWVRKYLDNHVDEDAPSGVVRVRHERRWCRGGSYTPQLSKSKEGASFSELRECAMQYEIEMIQTIHASGTSWYDPTIETEFFVKAVELWL